MWFDLIWTSTYSVIHRYYNQNHCHRIASGNVFPRRWLRFLSLLALFWRVEPFEFPSSLVFVERSVFSLSPKQPLHSRSSQARSFTLVSDFLYFQHFAFVTITLQTSCAGCRHNMPSPLWPWPLTFWLWILVFLCLSATDRRQAASSPNAPAGPA